MSYNVTRWTTKVLDGLCIPLEMLTRDDVTFPPEKVDINSGQCCVSWHSQCKIIGSINQFRVIGNVTYGMLRVLQIEICGDCSNHVITETLEPALKSSLGLLEALIIWEGGDSVTKLTSIDGNVEHTGVKK